MTAYLFPGQGSQSKGMGKDLFLQFPDIISQADSVLGYSITELCLEDPHNQLNSTQYTQPALYTVNAMHYLKKKEEGKPAPQFVAGHSLGEYSALFAAGVFDFATGLKLVKKRGELMSQALGGGMAAIIGLPADKIRKVLDENGLQEVVIANQNTHSQFVVSGRKLDVNRAQTLLEQAGASLVVPLNVSGAFHSPFMSAAQKEFEFFVKNFMFSLPSVPVIANCSAKPYVGNSEEIANHLTKQITHPVLWTDSIQYMIAQGVSAFEEIGPGKVLSGLVRRIKNGQ